MKTKILRGPWAKDPATGAEVGRSCEIIFAAKAEGYHDIYPTHITTMPRATPFPGRWEYTLIQPVRDWLAARQAKREARATVGK